MSYSYSPKYTVGAVASTTAVGVFIVGLVVMPTPTVGTGHSYKQRGDALSGYYKNSASPIYRIVETSAAPSLEYLYINAAKTNKSLNLKLASKNKKPNITFEDYNFVRGV